MSTISNTSESLTYSSTKSRSQSIPKPPSIPPPPIPASSSIYENNFKNYGSEIDERRVRAASESRISAKPVKTPRTVTDENLVSKRSVSFSRTRNPRSRTTTGKGILKKPKNEINDDHVTQEAQSGTLQSLKIDGGGEDEIRGRALSKKRNSKKSNSDLSLGKNDKRKEVLMVLPELSPAVEIAKEFTVPASDQKKEKDRNHSIFSNLGKTDADFVDRILKVHIHGADELITDVNIRSPLVRVSLIGIL